MQVTITITDKLIKSAITNALDNEVYENWNTATLKAAKIPGISVMTKEIFADPKFQAQIEREIEATAESAVEDYIYEMMDEINIPQIEDLCKRVGQAEDAIDAIDAEKKELAEVERMIKLLGKAGYKIEKA
jgi:hypothetical protein